MNVPIRNEVGRHCLLPKAMQVLDHAVTGNVHDAAEGHVKPKVFQHRGLDNHVALEQQHRGPHVVIPASRFCKNSRRSVARVHSQRSIMHAMNQPLSSYAQNIKTRNTRTNERTHARMHATTMTNRRGRGWDRRTCDRLRLVEDV